MQANNKTLIAAFIEAIWNQSAFERLDEFIDPNFNDHSLPNSIARGAKGLKQWIANTSASFDHHTIIEDQVSEGDKCVVKIRMNLQHIGEWRGVAPTNKSISTAGYRMFRVSDGRIIEHWALIDAAIIENQIKEYGRGCNLAK